MSKTQEGNFAGRLASWPACEVSMPRCAREIRGRSCPSTDAPVGSVRDPIDAIASCLTPRNPVGADCVR
jgi:hypothetical protein